MVLIATTDMTIEEAANQVEEYIKQQIDLKGEKYPWKISAKRSAANL